MVKILFVDDEPRMLRGLQRILSKKRKEWGMSFAEGGEAALRVLEEGKYDIIVTDMRMPGMSGVMLLTEVKTKYPEMTRIILSGQSDQEEVMKTVRLAHQYLAKPCNADELIGALSKAARFRSSLVSQDMSRLISKIEMLPSPSSSYRDIMEGLGSESVSMSQIGRIIAKDMGMSSNILKLVNSAFFSLPRRVANVVDAVVFLGLDIIKGLVLTHHLFSIFDFRKIPDLSYELLWNHSVNTACIGQAIIKSEIDDKSVIDDTFIAGLMHDVGKLAMGYVLQEEYAGIIRESRNKNLRLWKVETERLGFSHAEVGAYLSGIWGLPENLVVAIQHHHHPENCDQGDLLMLAVIHVADVFERQLCVSNHDYDPSTYNEEFLQDQNLLDGLDGWRKICKERLNCDEGGGHGQSG